jgi:hypothetical protein
MRELFAPASPTAAVWKASKHRLVGDPFFPEHIEAAPDAVWTRTDPFQTYRPATEHHRGAPSPHVPFLALADMVRAWQRPKRSERRAARSEENTKRLHDSVRVCADLYGLLGFFDETFAAPVLPSRVDRYAWLAPDAVIDKNGRMRVIDPATEGKGLLERLLDVRNPRTGRREGFKPDRLAFPHELRFPSVSFTAFGLLPPVFESLGSNMFSWENARNLYGVRALLDEGAGLSRVSVIYTREPLQYWHDELSNFHPSPNPPEYLNRKLKGVRPHAVAGADGRAVSSWHCPSLLKALYLMLYLDEAAGVRIQRCQASGCAEYFRVGPRSRESLYCPPPPGKKQSKCASRASSRMHRERQHRKS